MKNIEVEIRSFITKQQYGKLIDFFKKNAKHLGEDYQETYYFDSEHDVRIQKNRNGGKIWLKKGKLHDDQREEIEVHFPKDQFNNAEKLFLALGYTVEIKWFRTRNTFTWNDITVTIDFTRGYGYIIELEKMATKTTQDTVLSELRKKFEELGIEETPRYQFDKKFAEYKENWKKRTQKST